MVWSQSNKSPHELHIFFVNGSSLPASSHEMVFDLWHPRVLVSLLCISMFVALIVGDTFFGDTANLRHPPVMLGAAMTFLLVFQSVSRAAILIGTRRGWRSIPEPVLTVISAIIAALTAEGLAVLVQPDHSNAQMLRRIGAQVLFWEIAMTIFFIFVRPGAYKRQGQEAEPVFVNTQPAQPENDVLKLGKLLVQKDEIRRIESRGHRVLIRTTTGDHSPHAKMALIEQRLDGHGMLVHRSHWLAYSEFGVVEREGRRITMITRSGDTLPVSRNKAAAVRAILDKAEHPER